MRFLRKFTVLAFLAVTVAQPVMVAQTGEITTGELGLSSRSMEFFNLMLSDGVHFRGTVNDNDNPAGFKSPCSGCTFALPSSIFFNNVGHGVNANHAFSGGLTFNGNIGTEAVIGPYDNPRHRIGLYTDTIYTLGSVPELSTFFLFTVLMGLLGSAALLHCCGVQRIPIVKVMIKAFLPTKLVYVWCFVLLWVVLPVQSQFKEIGPPPFSAAIAHQKIRLLLTSVNPANRKQTVGTLSSWVAWYRDILDEELVAAWRRDSRANLPEVIEALGDARVASGVIAFSWRESRKETVNLAYASMLANLMSRYPKSSEPFLQDLLGQAPALSAAEAEGVCRILLDMPDLGTWRESALKILPRYTEVARGLLTQDLHASDDEEKIYRAEMWMAELKMDLPATKPTQQSRHRNISPDSTPDALPQAPRRVHVDGPPVPIETEPRQARSVLPSVPVPQATVPQAKPFYDGPKSGTYESTGSPVPQSAEVVFRNVPLVEMRLDYDSRIWEARFSPGDGKTQRLIVRNKSTSPQKRCVVRWSIVQ